jgi:hypothetical protein
VNQNVTNFFPKKQGIFAPNKFWNLYEQQNLKKTKNKAQQAISHLKSEDEGQVAFLRATSFIIIALCLVSDSNPRLDD